MHAAARSHVNRLCLAADVPLIESGSAGYQGQVSVIRKVRGIQDALNNDHGLGLCNELFSLQILGIKKL